VEGADDADVAIMLHDEEDGVELDRVVVVVVRRVEGVVMENACPSGSRGEEEEDVVVVDERDL